MVYIMNLNLCADVSKKIENEFRVGSEFLRREFPPTDFVCNSDGDLIHFDGPYNVEKHRAAYERAKKWVLDKDLIWHAKPGMKPFCRLFSNRIDPKKYKAFNVKLSFEIDFGSLTAMSEEGWSAGLPPMCIGMIGVFEKRPAVIVDRFSKLESVRSVRGVGDPECLFKDFNSHNTIKQFGLRVKSVRKEYWKIMTGCGDKDLPIGSMRFHRTNRVVSDFQRRGVYRSLKYICDPVEMFSEIAPRLELKEPQSKIPRKSHSNKKRRISM